jgi:hypothetical protein
MNGLDHGALNHYSRGSDLAAPSGIDIIMRRQIIESKGGCIT